MFVKFLFAKIRNVEKKKKRGKILIMKNVVLLLERRKGLYYVETNKPEIKM